MIVRIIKDRDLFFDRLLNKGLKANELNLYGNEAAHYIWRKIAKRLVNHINLQAIIFARNLKAIFRKNK